MSNSFSVYTSPLATDTNAEAESNETSILGLIFTSSLLIAVNMTAGSSADVPKKCIQSFPSK